jgi:hypothetical protein
VKRLHRYRQPKRASEVQTVVVAGPHHVAALGKKLDLRTGATSASKAAAFAPDGAWVEWERSGDLVIVTPAGTRTRVTGIEGVSTLVKLLSDEVLLLQADGRQPLLCIDRATGAPLGRFDDMRGEAYEKMRLYNTAVFDPRDGKTVWLCEGNRVVQFSLATRKPLQVFEPRAGEKYLGVAAHPDGWVMTTARALSAGFDTSNDELVLLRAGSGEVKRVRRTCMSFAPLRAGFVAFEPAAKQFVFLDFALEETGRLEHDSNWAQLLALPSLEEWITIGGHGEWDHHGREGLGAPLAQPATASSRSKTPSRRTRR